MPDCSIDSIVTDPPYALVSIQKRFGKPGSAATKVPEGGSGAYARASSGFMGKQWDTGETAFSEEFWAECLRVLKPGGHVVAFSGTRTYHRMVVAIEDAGFEIRDQLAWVYGSGFPKNHDVSKGIDKAAPRASMFAPFAEHYAERRKETGLTHNTICAAGGFFAAHNHGGASVNWEKGHNVPTLAQWVVLQPLLSLSDEWLPLIERVEAEREKIGERKSGDPVAWYGEANRGDGIVNITAPATDAAREWQGWGTALKPSWEPIVLARKPLAGTVAANVLEFGTGALNVDGCRVAGEMGTDRADGKPRRTDNTKYGKANEHINPQSPLGRWPANIIHDGSDEVVAAFPDSAGQQGDVTGNEPSPFTNNCYGHFSGRPATKARNDAGSAARFFYSAKADKNDRMGSKHPTVKPVDLMQWLVRLVTPKGGVVLDPFAGSGSTGEAAWREGMRCILVEREEEYQADIAERLRLANAGPSERRARAIKQSANDNLPLFGAA
jgi:site-specific DNA-methyltransferase (adenine-specific)